MDAAGGRLHDLIKRRDRGEPMCGWRRVRLLPGLRVIVGVLWYPS
jgi:hypothetical protein